MAPGRFLHRFARLACGATSFERVVEPAIADLQLESQRRVSQHRLRRIVALVLGYVAVWKVIVLCGLMPERSVEDRRALTQTLGWTASATLVVAVPLILIPLAGFPMSTLERVFLVGLIPQALPLALPAGLTFGVALGLAGRFRSRQIAKDVAVLTVSTAILSLIIAAWWMPVANQAYRQSLFEATGGRGVVMRGPTEMGFPEVIREAAVNGALGNFRQARFYRWSLHNRLALPVAAVALPAFLFFMSSTQRTVRVLIALGACWGYLTLMISGGSLAASTAGVNVALAAWVPNLTFGGAALLLRRYS
jgi:hypothetical protein